MVEPARVAEIKVGVRKRLDEAEKLAQLRVKQIEAEARNVLAGLTALVRPQVERLFTEYKTRTWPQWAWLGGELIKLGEKLQTLAKAPTAPPPEESGPVVAK